MAKYGVSVTNVQPGKHTAYVKEPVVDKSARATGLNTFAQGINVAGNILAQVGENKAKSQAEDVSKDVEAVATEYHQSNISGAPSAVQSLASIPDPASGMSVANPNNWAVTDSPEVTELRTAHKEKLDVLTRAKQQQGMSELELYERVNSITRAAVARNPYYTSELMSAASNTLSLNNVAKRVAFNNKYYDAITTASNKMQQKNYELALKERIIIPLKDDGSIDHTALQQHILNHNKHESSIEEIQKVTEMNEAQMDRFMTSGKGALVINSLTHHVEKSMYQELDDKMKNEGLKGSNITSWVEQWHNNAVRTLMMEPAFAKLNTNEDGRAEINSAIERLKISKEALVSRIGGEDLSNYIKTQLDIQTNLISLGYADLGFTTDVTSMINNLSSASKNYMSIVEGPGFTESEKSALKKDINALTRLTGKLNTNLMKGLTEALSEQEPGTSQHNDIQKQINMLEKSTQDQFDVDPLTKDSLADRLLKEFSNYFEKAELTGSPDLTQNTIEQKNMKQGWNNTLSSYFEHISSITGIDKKSVDQRAIATYNLFNDLAQSNPKALSTVIDRKNRDLFNNEIPILLEGLRKDLDFYIDNPATEDARIDRLADGSLLLEGIPTNSGIGQRVASIVRGMNNSWKAYANINDIPKTNQNASEFFGKYFKNELEKMEGIRTYGIEDQPKLDNDNKLEVLPMDGDVIVPDENSSSLFNVNEYSTADVKGPTKDWKSITDKIKSDSKFLKLADDISEKLEVDRNNYLNMIQAISNVESYGGDYSAVGTNATGAEMWGKYQFAPRTRNEISRKLKYKKMPSKKTFLNSPLLQEKFYTVYADQINRHLKANSPKYNKMTPLQRLPYIAAGQFGMGSLVKYLEGGAKVTDSKGTDIGIFIKAYTDHLSTLPNYGNQYSDVMEGEQLVNMRKVLEGKITGKEAEEIRTNFLEEFSPQALEQLKREIK